MHSGHALWTVHHRRDVVSFSVSCWEANYVIMITWLGLYGPHSFLVNWETFFETMKTSSFLSYFYYHGFSIHSWFLPELFIWWLSNCDFSDSISSILVDILLHKELFLYLLYVYVNMDLNYYFNLISLLSFWFLITALFRHNCPTIELTHSKVTVQWVLVHYRIAQQSALSRCNTFHYPRKKPLLMSSHSVSYSLLLETTKSILSLWICLLWTLHVNKIIQYVIICDWFLLLSIMFWRSIHAIVCISTSSHCRVIFHCMGIPHLVYLSVDGHLDCFHFLATMNNE